MANMAYCRFRNTLSDFNDCLEAVEFAGNLEAELSPEEFKPQGYLTLSNSGGIEIEINDSGDAVRFRMYNGNVSHWQEIKFDKDGEMYFYAYSNRYYLNQFMRYE